MPALVSYHSSPEVHRYLPMEAMGAETIRTRLREGPWARTTLEEEGEALCLGAELTATGQLVGDVMLRWVSAVDRCGELGYVFDPVHGGNGYATEAAGAVLALAFGAFDLHRVIARIDARNTPSLRLAQRLGMRKEGHLMENHWHEDGWSDEVDFALLQGEWSRAISASPAGGPQ